MIRFGMLVGLLLAGSAQATVKPQPSPADVARAIVEQGQKSVRVSDIRVRGCRVIEEGPTEFDCAWSQRSGKSRCRFRTMFGLDGKRWHIIDWPPSRG